MGGGPDKEHMVIVLWSPAPEARLAELKSLFPYIDITYLNLGDHKHPTPNGTKQEIPAEVYAKATIWVTLGVLPPTASTVPQLKWLHLFSAGVDHFHDHPIFTAPDDRITITTSSGVSAPPIAEWVLMTTLASTKHFTTTWEWQKEKRWGGNGMHLTQGRDWVGKTVGIAGYGSIGRQVARLFSALGSRILAYTARPRPTAASRADTGYMVAGTGDPLGQYPSAWYSGTSRTELHGFLQQGLDLLVICLPLTPATTHLLGAEEFAMLAGACGTPGGPYVANVSRGRIVQQAALVAALNAGVLAGAMLDVVDPEPLPEGDPLWGARNVVITPHVSGLGVEYMDRAYDVLEGNLGRRERGEALWNVVGGGRGY